MSRQQWRNRKGQRAPGEYSQSRETNEGSFIQTLPGIPLFSELRIRLFSGDRRVPLTWGFVTCFRGEGWGGGPSDTPDSAGFSNSFGSKYPICHRAIFGGSVLNPTAAFVTVPTCCVHVVLGQLKQPEVHVGDWVKGATGKENHFCLLGIFHARTLKVLI